jgi:chaperone modulatory protein CbpM
MASATRRPGRGSLVKRAPELIALAALAREAGLHPELVARLVSLGLIEPRGGTASVPLFRRQDARLLARAARLRGDLGLDYAGAVLATELLARIEELEQRLRRGAPTDKRHEVIAWTRTVSH